MRIALLGLVACAHPSAPPAPPPAPAPDAAVAIVIPIDAPPLRECWTEGPVLRTPAVPGDPVPVPVSTSTYPLRFTLLAKAEIDRRTTLLHTRYPDLTFQVDDLGVIRSLVTDRVPCEALVMHAWLTALASEVPDVPLLATYGVQPINGSKLVVSQTRDVPDVIAHMLPTRELDDAALNAKWGTGKVQWFKIETTEKVTPQPNPCLGSHVPLPCDPPGPRRETITHRRLLGSRPAKKYLSTPERTTVLARNATTVEVRRVAAVEIETGRLANDIPAARQNVVDEGPYEIDITGTDRRDAVTGEALPHSQR